MALIWNPLGSLAGPPGPAGPAGPAGADGAGPRRHSLGLSTPVLQPAERLDCSVAAGSVFQLLAIEASHPCWLRVYGSAEARSADERTAAGEPLPPAGSGFYAELVTTSSGERIVLAPVPTVQSPDGQTYLRLVHTAASAQALTLHLDVLTLEP